ALGAEYRLCNVCTAAGERGVAGDALRAHDSAIRLAELLHGALVEHCLGQPTPWRTFRAMLEDWTMARGLMELVARERNVTGELATLYSRWRTEQLQQELLALIEEIFKS
ncbi:MAG: hypothetical protein V2A77_02940, partial [Pseudomonadota bacterium]